MSTDETRPLPADETQPLPLGSTADGTTADDATADETRDAADDTATAPRRDRARVGTIVWGVVIALLGAGVLTIAAGYTIDLELAAIGLLVVAGLGLIVGPLVANARRGRSEEAATPRG